MLVLMLWMRKRKRGAEGVVGRILGPFSCGKSRMSGPLRDAQTVQRGVLEPKTVFEDLVLVILPRDSCSICSSH